MKKKFDMIEIKKRIDEKRMENFSKPKTLTEKIVEFLVSALALFMFYSLSVSFSFDSSIQQVINGFLILLLAIRGYFVFKKR